MPHTIAINAADHPISSVMVYESGAEIVLKLSFDLEVGQSEIQISHLPSCIDPSSLRVERKGNPVIFDVISQNDTADPAELKTLEAGLADLKRDQQVLQSQLSLLHGYAKAITAKDVRSAQYPEYLRAHGVHGSALRKQAAQVEEEITTVELNISTLRGRSPQSPAMRVTLVVLAQRAISAELTLKYVVTDASWSPLYDTRATLPVSGTGEHAIELSGRASVMQTKAESWKDVALSLSTNRPSDYTTPKELKMQHVRQVPASSTEAAWMRPIPQAHMPFVERLRMAEEAAHVYPSPEKGETYASDYNPYAESPSTPTWYGTKEDADETDEIKMEHYVRPVSTARATEKDRIPLAPVSMATPDAHAYHVSATFQIEGLSNIPSDGATHKVTIATVCLDAKTEWLAIPKLYPAPFMQCRVTNSSPYVLLSGASNLYLDGDFVGKSAIPFSSPQEELSIPIGSDPAI